MCSLHFASFWLNICWWAKFSKAKYHCNWFTTNTVTLSVNSKQPLLSNRFNMRTENASIEHVMWRKLRMFRRTSIESVGIIRWIQSLATLLMIWWGLAFTVSWKFNIVFVNWTSWILEKKSEKWVFHQKFGYHFIPLLINSNSFKKTPKTEWRCWNENENEDENQKLSLRKHGKKSVCFNKCYNLNRCRCKQQMQRGKKTRASIIHQLHNANCNLL